MRNNVPYLDALDAEMIPSPTAAGDFMRRFEQEDVVELMEALGAVRPQLWKGRGRELLGPVAYVDVDGTVAPTQGEKKAGMDMSYKGVWGYHPLIISLANTGEVLSLVNRPGNVPGTSEFSEPLIRYTLLEAAVSVLDEESWQPLKRRPRRPSGQTRAKRPNEKDRIVEERGYTNLRLNFTEFTVRGSAARSTGWSWSERTSKITLFDETRYHYYITTRTDVSAAELVRLANQRGDQENLIAQLKSGVDAMRVPLYDLVSNWAYMVIATLAWNLKSWFALMMHRKADRRRYVAMEFRTFIREMILIPCQVIRRARRTTLRIIGWQPSVDRLFSVWGAIERTGFG